MKTSTLIVGLLLSLCLAAGSHSAQSPYNNERALESVDRAAVYFDVNVDDAARLLLRLNLARRTLDHLADAGVEATAVIGFRGGASRFITRQDHYVLEEEKTWKAEIQTRVRDLVDGGVLIEQCNIAAELLDIPPGDFLDEVAIVKNGYVSLVGYQVRGYAVVPMD